MTISRRTAVAGAFALPVLGLAGQARAAEHQVTIQGFAFAPARLEVAVGDTVTFLNNDGAPHTATADTFDTGRMNRGDSASVTIESAGEHSYVCQFHPAMKGVIVAS